MGRRGVVIPYVNWRARVAEPAPGETPEAPERLKPAAGRAMLRASNRDLPTLWAAQVSNRTHGAFGPRCAVAMSESAGPPPAAESADDAARAVRGDLGAFERLYHGHVARVHGLARRMIGPGEADEVTQDIFVRAFQKLGTFRGEAAFGTWLHRLAINVILTRRGQLGLWRRRMVDDEHALEAVAARPSGHELVMDFEAAIGRLPEGARQVFVLHDVEGYTHEEASAMLGVTAGTTKAQLHRARMLLRRKLRGGRE